MMFEALSALRQEIDAIPAHVLAPDHMRRIVNKLRNLDDAMVHDVREEQLAREQASIAEMFAHRPRRELPS